ncbi:hypothetical protein [Janibacter sp. LM]|uniref:hypothetical protein n=1 Tax=Janibacter sp. LM TaxID=3144845 RepID=UPI0031F69D19
MPLSVLRGQRRPGRAWTHLDRLAALALQAYEDGLCGSCGTPRVYGMDPDAHRHYTAPAETCHACAARDRANDTDAKRPPGQHRYVTPDEVQTYSMTHPIHVPPFHA